MEAGVVAFHRQDPVRYRLSGANRWFISIHADTDAIALDLAEHQSVIGVDLGVSALITLSTVPKRLRNCLAVSLASTKPPRQSLSGRTMPWFPKANGCRYQRMRKKQEPSYPGSSPASPISSRTPETSSPPTLSNGFIPLLSKT